MPYRSPSRGKQLADAGAEVQHVADKSAGQASTPLEQLVRAYALVTADEPLAVMERTAPSLHGRSHRLSPTLDRVLIQKAEA